MFFRQLTQPQYDRFCLDLRKHAFSPPLSPNYIVPLIINGAEYVILLQPESHNRIAVIYAMEILREEDTVSHILITKNAHLRAFLEILLMQGIPF